MRLSAHCLSQPLIYVVPSDGLRLGLGGMGGMGAWERGGVGGVGGVRVGVKMKE